MAKAVVPSYVQELVRQMTELVPGPESVWLIGSRANGRATSESDSDLLVFGSPAFLATARASLNRVGAVDLLVVTGDDEFQDVWTAKTGSLKRWEWKQVSADGATYKGCKWISDPPDEAIPGVDMGTLIHRDEVAVRLWP